ncbi:NUP50 domain containing protein [Asbolus verrucosus]|uniref:NUP50 domain containing protein n=1 Tax=Asbolus verrucosus TaxID=1661398 RepID=A0A482VPD7_ASBVE|nr:NUP50 domain containing protein [Asbolus verrucosus]
MAKRTATNELNHDNWDREDDPEDAGTFSKASEEALKKRIIKVAKRRNPISSVHNEDEKTSAFGGFSGFGKTAPVASTSAFGFLANLTNKTDSPKTNGTPEKTEKSDKKLDEYYAKLKGLNESVAEWIKKHVTTNPLINLQPVFKDYDKYITELEKLKSEAVSDETEAGTAAAPKSGTTATSSPPKFSFGTNTPTTAAPSFSFGSTAASSTASGTTLSVGGNSFSSSFSFGGNATSSDGKFTFTSTVVKAADDASTDQEDEPPKVEFTPVVEEGHSYTTRCKVFVKKDGSFVDHGVGTLYLKPVPDSEKTQLFVRADTNLGNLICNFILSEGIPMQRMGKKDVMLVCLPTPETKPPPVPILLRVKSAEDADELLKTLQKHKK